MDQIIEDSCHNVIHRILPNFIFPSQVTEGVVVSAHDGGEGGHKQGDGHHSSKHFIGSRKSKILCCRRELHPRILCRQILHLTAHIILYRTGNT